MSIIDQPNWLPCRDCGKTGPHTHSGPNRPMLLGDLVEGGVERDAEALDGALDWLRRQPDPEHEPDNPNCLCFQQWCIRKPFDLDALISRVVESRREALKHMSPADVRDWFTHRRAQ